MSKNLLGSGILRRQRAPAGLRERCLVVGLQEFRDAEVEQLHTAVGRDQDVRRLQIAMDDQTRVCMRHRIKHLDHKRQAIRDREPLAVAVRVQSRAIHILEHEIGLPRTTHTGIKQPRDTGMGESGKDVAFTTEALVARATNQGQVEQLDRDCPVVAPIAACSPPHLAHAALTKRRIQHVGPDRRAAQGRARHLRERCTCRAIQIPCLLQGQIFRQERRDERRERGVGCAQRVEVPIALGFVQFERGIDRRS